MRLNVWGNVCSSNWTTRSASRYFWDLTDAEQKVVFISSLYCFIIHFSILSLDSITFHFNCTYFLSSFSTLITLHCTLLHTLLLQARSLLSRSAVRRLALAYISSGGPYSSNFGTWLRLVFAWGVFLWKGRDFHLSQFWTGRICFIPHCWELNLLSSKTILKNSKCGISFWVVHPRLLKTNVDLIKINQISNLFRIDHVTVKLYKNLIF